MADDSGRSAMPVYITPYYDSKGPKVAVGPYSQKLAGADAKSILDVSRELLKEKETLRCEVMYVAAIRLYDLGHKDEAAYWYYTAQYRARLFTSILDSEKIGSLGSEAFELKHAYGAFNQLVGEFINGYAFGDLAKLEKTLLKVLEENKSPPKFAKLYPGVKFVAEESWEGKNKKSGKDSPASSSISRPTPTPSASSGRRTESKGSTSERRGGGCWLPGRQSIGHRGPQHNPFVVTLEAA